MMCGKLSSTMERVMGDWIPALYVPNRGERGFNERRLGGSGEA
jgi:hypothetical protein